MAVEIVDLQLMTCASCTRELPVCNFSKRRDRACRYRSKCKECTSKYLADWLAANPERLAEYKSRKQASGEKYKSKKRPTAEAKRTYSARYYEKHKQRLSVKYRENAAKWLSENPEKAAEKKAKRRACKGLAQPSWANKFFISEAYRLAKLRTALTGLKWEVDHIVPLKSNLVCGLHVEHNLSVVPAIVNSSKGNRHWPDMP